MAVKTKDNGANGARSAAAIFKALDDKMWKPGGGCSSPLDYMEQSSWLLFLRYLDAREEDRRMECELRGDPYEPALPKPLRWSSWAWPTRTDGSFDYDRAPKGQELIDFVNDTLFPGLERLADNAPVNSVQYRIGSIFSQLSCRFTDGFLLREVIDLMEPLKFQTEDERHELSVLYEERLAEMGNAGIAGGQYYTPRPLIRVMVRLLDPQIGETFDDSACGSAGFICEAFAHMRAKAQGDARAYLTLQEKTFSGGECKALAYVTAQMNCILHGLESPQIRFGDTLATKIADFGPKDRVDVIGANPPFGAAVNAATKQNFIVQTSETALMFMEYFIAKLKKGGRAAIIIKNTFLSNTDNASVAIRRMLLDKCRLHWILDLPQKVFTAGVHTVVLFFTKDGPTTAPIHYWQLDLKGETLGKKRPLRESDLAGFEALASGFWRPEGAGGSPAESHSAAWSIDPKALDPTTLDLSVVNPNIEAERLPTKAECESAMRDAWRKIGTIAAKNASREPGESRFSRESRSSRISSCSRPSSTSSPKWPIVRLGDVCEVRAGADYKAVRDDNGAFPVYGTGGVMCRANAWRCPANSVIVGRKGTLDNPMLVKEPFWNIDTCFGLIPKESILPEYLYFFCRNFDFYSLCQASGRPSTNSDAIKAISLPLPPLSEQEVIVAQLDAEMERADGIVEQARRLAAAAENLKKALLKEAFE